MELLWENCRQERADLESETNRAGRVLADYSSGLASVAEWLGDLDVRLRAGALDPQEMRTATEELQSELAVTAVTLADVTRLAGVITERARRQRQRADVQQAVQRRQQELDAARTRLEKRRAQVRYLGEGEVAAMVLMVSVAGDSPTARSVICHAE